MSDAQSPTPDDTAKRLERRAARQLRHRRERKTGAAFGLRVFGLVGWSVAIPTLLGAGLGWWLDRDVRQAGFSWTLALILAGVTVGCFNAWYWIASERKRPIGTTDDEDEGEKS